MSFPVRSPTASTGDGAFEAVACRKLVTVNWPLNFDPSFAVPRTCTVFLPTTSGGAAPALPAATPPTSVRVATATTKASSRISRDVIDVLLFPFGKQLIRSPTSSVCRTGGGSGPPARNEPMLPQRSFLDQWGSQTKNCQENYCQRQFRPQPK